jgi:AraC-like DNA-binding protein
LIFSYITFANIALLLFAILLFIFSKNNKSNRYLLFYLINLGLHTVLRFGFSHGGYHLIVLPYILFPSAFLFGPLLYLYTRSVLYENSHTKTEVILFSIPVVIIFITHIAFNILYPEMGNVTDILTQSGVIATYTITMIIIGNIYNILITLLAFRSLKKYIFIFYNNFAITKIDEILWLKVLLFFNVSLYTCYILTTLFTLGETSNFLPVNSTEGFIMLGMAYLILFYYIKKPSLFILDKNILTEKEETSLKYTKQNLSETTRKEYLKKIEEYFVLRKPYLEESISLSEISAKIGISSHHFSMTINIEKNRNFYNFINDYRIEEAKKILEDKNISSTTILEIAYKSGFQSKSVFNRVFKQITGKSPKDYRSSFLK